MVFQHSKKIFIICVFGDNAFSNNPSLKNLIISCQKFVIGTQAYANCKSLKEVEIHNNDVEVEVESF